MWSLAACVSCGRIGFEETPGTRAVATDGGGGATEATGGTGGTAALDASSSGGAAQTDGGTVDRAPDTAAGRATEAGATDAGRGQGGRDASAGVADGALDASTDARTDARDASTCGIGPTSADYCATLPFLPQAPVIDGKLDCGPPLRDLTPVGWTGGATPPDASARYAVAWRPDGLYFFVQVSDPSRVPARSTESTWQGDAVEIYVDSDGSYAAPPAYDDPGTRQFTIAVPAGAQESVARAEVWFNNGSSTPWASTEFRAYALPDGYVVEAFVSGADLGLATLALVAGGHVGMDLSIDVSFPTDQGPDAGGFGNRLGQYFLRVAAPDAGEGIPPFDPRAFCKPALAAR